jgi:formylglycine-generating enzyme required for sulfatase activity
VDGADYLDGWTGASFPDGTGSLPVSHVTHEAAAAFCRWMTESLPPGWTGFEVRLPTEAEWDWAARAGRSQLPEGGVFLDSGGLGDAAAGPANAWGLVGLPGGVWEWTADWYFPVANLLVSTEAGENPLTGDAVGSQRVVKGGSWANQREEIRPETRGAQPPDWATPYTGFRVVLAPTRE